MSSDSIGGLTEEDFDNIDFDNVESAAEAEVKRPRLLKGGLTASMRRVRTPPRHPHRPLSLRDEQGGMLPENPAPEDESTVSPAANYNDYLRAQRALSSSIRLTSQQILLEDQDTDSAENSDSNHAEQQPQKKEENHDTSDDVT